MVWIAGLMVVVAAADCWGDDEISIAERECSKYVQFFHFFAFFPHPNPSPFHNRANLHGCLYSRQIVPPFDRTDQPTATSSIKVWTFYKYTHILLLLLLCHTPLWKTRLRTERLLSTGWIQFPATSSNIPPIWSLVGKTRRFECNLIL